MTAGMYDVQIQAWLLGFAVEKLGGQSLAGEYPGLQHFPVPQ